jgi:hypothetical protein
VTSPVVTVGFCRERHIAAKTLVIAFSSLGVTRPDQAYEFDGLLARTDCSVMLLRDVATSWYHAVPGVEDGVPGLAAFLAGRTEAYERIVCVGHSMGGYAALLFGRLLAADAVLAVVPQTVLTASTLEAFGDRRWSEKLEPLQARTPPSPYLDLAPLFAAPDLAAPGQRVTIYTAAGGVGEALDLAHANWLSPSASVVRIGQGPVAHLVPLVALRMSGLLRWIIDGAIGGEAPALAAVTDAYAAWMAARRHRLDIATAVLSSDGRLSLAGTIANTGTVPIALVDGVLMGARLWPGDRAGEPLGEHRFALPGPWLEPGTSLPFDFDLDLSGLAPGAYVLSVALVHEGRFWFDDLGFAAIDLAFDAHPFGLVTEDRGAQAAHG